MSQSELADRLDVTRGAVNNLLSGRSKVPSIETMQKLADIFHVLPDEVFRAAGLLSKKEKRAELEEQAVYYFEQIKSEESKRKVLDIIKLFTGDEGDVKGKRAKP